MKTYSTSLDTTLNLTQIARAYFDLEPALSELKRGLARAARPSHSPWRHRARGAVVTTGCSRGGLQQHWQAVTSKSHHSSWRTRTMQSLTHVGEYT